MTARPEKASISDPVRADGRHDRRTVVLIPAAGPAPEAPGAPGAPVTTLMPEVRADQGIMTAPAPLAGSPAAVTAAAVAQPAPAAAAATARQPRSVSFPVLWLSVFGTALGLFVLRFLVPSPVGMADNGDGPRLMCGLGVAPVTGSFPGYDAYAFFRFVPSPACAGAGIYPSSEHLLLVAAQWLTPVLGLQGKVSLIALGLITCVLASAGIASLAAGLRISLRARLLIAVVLWLVMADAAFFDTYASPFSEGATLVGLLLVAAGVIYLGRGLAAAACGLALTAAGGYLAILSKEQYLPLAVPICLTLVVASAARHGTRRVRLTRWVAAALVAGVLGGMALAAVHQDDSSPFNKLLTQEQAVDVIFDSIVNGHDNASADLRALGLPASWAKYAGHGFAGTPSVYYDPLYSQYAARLNDANIAHFLLTHPLRVAEIGQRGAVAAMRLRVSNLGSYEPAAAQQPGALENRVVLLSRLVATIPFGLGLFWLGPLWIAALAIAWMAWRRRRSGPPWRTEVAAVVFCMTGCSLIAFGPAAYFAGVEMTRHMLGMNLALALALPLSVALLGSMIGERSPAPAARARAEPARARAEPGSGPDRATVPAQARARRHRAGAVR